MAQLPPFAALSHRRRRYYMAGFVPRKVSTGGDRPDWEKRVMESDTLDTKGLLCPLPVLKARKALKAMAEGGTLEVLATDPGAVKDFAAFCRTTGHQLVESTAEAGVFRFLIRKNGP